MQLGSNEREPTSLNDKDVTKLDIVLGVAATAVGSLVSLYLATEMYKSYNTENFDVNTGFTFLAVAATAVSAVVTYMMIDQYQEQKKTEQPPLA